MPEQDRQDYSRWRETLSPFIKSKKEEFELLGLNRVSEEELWRFIESVLQKKKVEQRIHRVTEAVMSVSVNDYLNKIRIEMFKGTGLEPLKGN